MQTDPELQALALEDTLQKARYVANIAAPMLPNAELGRLVAVRFILMQFP